MHNYNSFSFGLLCTVHYSYFNILILHSNSQYISGHGAISFIIEKKKKTPIQQEQQRNWELQHKQQQHLNNWQWKWC